MSDTTNDPQLTDPPTNTGGGGTSTDVEETADATTMTDPPTNTGGGGSA
jgi:hypothetical protein